MNINIHEDSLQNADEFILLNEEDHTHLDELWDQLNYSDEQKKSERNRLDTLLKEETRKVLENEFKKKQELLNQLQETRSNYCKMLKALARPQEEIENANRLGQNGTLLERIDDLKSACDAFLPTYIVRVKLFNDFWNRVTYLFDKMGIIESERDGFSEFDNDNLSPENEQRYKDQIQLLEKEYKERLRAIEGLNEKIRNLARDIGETISPIVDAILKSKQVTAVSYNTAIEYCQDLESIKQNRAKEMSLLALEITHCWDLLNVPNNQRKEFIASHSTLSQENIQAFESQLNELHNQIESNLPELLEQVRQDIVALCKSMQYTEQQINEQLVELNTEKETFYFLEKSLLELKKLNASSQPIIQMIKQREEIIDQYQSINKKKPDQAADKIKRRYKTILPRIEKKLGIELVKYEEIHSRPFTWNGENMLEKLEHIKLSQSEIKQAKNQARKKSQKT